MALDDYQNYRNLELLLVNDGSTDNSEKIIEDYKNKYPEMIKAFHVDNAGVSNGRNVGLKECTGDLITFIDADDYISPTYIEELTLPFIEEYGEPSRKYFNEINHKIEYYSSTAFLTLKHKLMLTTGCYFPEIIPLLRKIKTLLLGD